ncbi:MAG: TolC family protein [Phycisphaerae bacterium]|nr:TolC family protein [Phycisphaerae bacterium]MDD5380080.1 TolC family protein [Phycisphaerae bacterium]
MKQQAVMVVGVIIFMFTPSVRGSQPPSDASNLVRLEDYLQYASLNNANLKAMFEEWRAALEQIPQTKALPDPQLQYGYYARQSEMQMNQMVGVMQMFPWFGKIDARTEVAAKSAEAAQQKYRGAQLTLFKEVKEGFYEYVYLAKATEIAKENLELLRYFEEVARTKYTTAEAGQPDMIRAQVELARMEYVLSSLEQLREPVVSKLRSALTLPTDTNLPWPKQEEFKAVPLDYGRLVTLLIQKNPELAGLNFEAMAAKSRIELAKKNFYPDIGIGVEWTQFDKSGGNSGRDAVALVFQMNLPLWRDSYSAGQRQAQAMAASIEHQKIDTENTLLAKAAQSYYDYNDSIRKIHLYKDTLIPKGEELLQASETAYKAGTIDFLSLLDSQRLLLDYYLSYQRALADNRQKLAGLEMLAGAELESERTN